MKILRIGDPHAKINNLAEMKSLFDFVLNTAEFYKVDRIEILGDLFHTHAVLRLEVQEFWMKTLNMLSEQFYYDTVVLVGNHDMSGNYNSTFSALSLFAIDIGDDPVRLSVIESPQRNGIFGYMPYIHDQQTFINEANKLADQGAKVLVCHQTLQGSRYESGFYAADGVPTGDWAARFTHIISGHIHSEQTFENVIYPGTARWDGVVDANIRKGIWIYEHDDDTGQIVKSDFYSTENVCSPLRSIAWKEGDPAPTPWADNERVTLELVGSSEWVNKQKQSFKGKASFKTKITDSKKLESRKSGKSFAEFLNGIFVTSMNKEELEKKAREWHLV